MLVFKLGRRIQTNFKLPVRISLCTFRHYSDEKPKETSLYDSLGLRSSATPGEVKKAYYDLSFKYHPDRNKDSVEASNKFREVTEAYEVLGNYSLRKRYDKGLPLPTKERTINRSPIVETPVKFQTFFDSRTSQTSRSGTSNDDLSNTENNKHAYDRSQLMEEEFQKSRGISFIAAIFICIVFILFRFTKE